MRPSVILFSAVQFILLLIQVTNSIYSPQDIPNPNVNPEKCGRNNVPKSSLCDPKSYLDSESQNVIEGYINAASEYCQIGVLVIDKISPDFIGKRTTQLASEDFATSVHNRWGIGDPKTQNGVLIFMSIQDRQTYISTGSGVSKKLSESVLDNVIEAMRPYLRKQEYGKALECSVVEISLLVSGKKTIQFTDSTSFQKLMELFPLLCFLGFFGGYGIYESRRMAQMERGRGALDKFMKDVKDSQTDPKYMTPSCPICLEDFPSSPDSQTAHTDIPIPLSLASQQSDEASRKTESKKSELQHPKRPMSLQCGHVFCHECLSAHFKQSKQKDRCPICREHLDPMQPKSPPPEPGGPPHFGYFGSFTGQNQQSRPSTCAETINSENLPTYGAQQSYQHPHQESQHNSDNTFPQQQQQQQQQSNQQSQRYPYQQFNYGNQQNSINRWLEWQFRLNRLRYIYPGVIDHHSYSVMNSAIQQQNVAELIQVAEVRQNAVQRIVTDYRTRQKAAKSGSSGSRSSFGGGSSSGGRGGGW